MQAVITNVRPIHHSLLRAKFQVNFMPSAQRVCLDELQTRLQFLALFLMYCYPMCTLLQRVMIILFYIYIGKGEFTPSPTVFSF